MTKKTSTHPDTGEDTTTASQLLRIYEASAGIDYAHPEDIRLREAIQEAILTDWTPSDAGDEGARKRRARLTRLYVAAAAIAAPKLTDLSFRAALNRRIGEAFALSAVRARLDSQPKPSGVLGSTFTKIARKGGVA